MTASFKILVLGALLSSAGYLLPGQTQSRHANDIHTGSNRIECDFQKIDGSTYRDQDREFEVVLPNGVAAVVPAAPCLHHGFEISLAHLRTGQLGPDFASSHLWVVGAEHTRETFQYIINRLPEALGQDSERTHATDLQLEPPEQTLLSSLPALHLKYSRTEEHGELIYEETIANNPHLEIVYHVGMVSPADQYENNAKVFKAVVRGFSYVPAEHVANHK